MKNLALVLFLVGLYWASSRGLSEDYSKWGEFAPQVASFTEAAKARNKTIDLSNITIELISAISGNGQELLGLCLPEQHTVLISAKFWANMDDAHKDEVVWHELGHCVLGREHLDLVKDGHPVSIMMSHGQLICDDEVYWFYNRPHILDELFSIIP